VTTSWITNDPAAVGVTTTLEPSLAPVIVAPVVPALRIVHWYDAMLRPAPTIDVDCNPTAWLAVGVVVVSEIAACTPAAEATAARASSMPAPHSVVTPAPGLGQ
jgi:hypothetical protein